MWFLFYLYLCGTDIADSHMLASEMCEKCCMPLKHFGTKRYITVVKQWQVCWADIIHWMWSLFTESWGSWRNDCLNLSPIPFTVSIIYNGFCLYVCSRVYAAGTLLRSGFLITAGSSYQSSFVACARGVTFITVSIMPLIINLKPMPYMRTINLIHLHILHSVSYCFDNGKFRK